MTTEPTPPPVASETSERPGWGHGDSNHVHTGPPGQDGDGGNGKNGKN